MILALLEHDAGVISSHSVQTLNLARAHAGSIGAPLHALAIGPGAVGVAGSAGKHGATVLYAVDLPGGTYAPRAWARAVIALLDRGEARMVFAPGSERGNEVMAYVGAISGLPVVTSCVAVSTTGKVLQVSRLRWAGTIIEDAELEVAGAKLVTVAAETGASEIDSRGTDVEPEPSEVAAVHPLAVPTEPDDLRVRVVEVIDPPSDRIALTDARVVVGGGRGVGSEEGFRILDELAGLLGGAVGVSRAVTSLGWRSHGEQIGQTGCRISPELYIACGISGAVQHMVGCKAARKILAINSDPQAPIMARADYTLVGDLHAVLPAIIEELRRVLASSQAS